MQETLQIHVQRVGITQLCCSHVLCGLTQDKDDEECKERKSLFSANLEADQFKPLRKNTPSMFYSRFLLCENSSFCSAALFEATMNCAGIR